MSRRHMKNVCHKKPNSTHAAAYDTLAMTISAASYPNQSRPRPPATCTSSHIIISSRCTKDSSHSTFPKKAYRNFCCRMRKSVVTLSAGYIKAFRGQWHTTFCFSAYPGDRLRIQTIRNSTKMSADRVLPAGRVACTRLFVSTNHRIVIYHRKW